MRIPGVVLPATTGRAIDLAELASGRLVLFCYPRTGRPGVDPLPGWDAIPGARGCTPQACAYRDRHAEIAAFGYAVAGLSAQSPGDQLEFAQRAHIPFPVLSDERLELAASLRLPTFSVAGLMFYRRLTLIAEQGSITKVFYPVFPPDRDADNVIEWIERRRGAEARSGSIGR